MAASVVNAPEDGDIEPIGTLSMLSMLYPLAVVGVLVIELQAGVISTLPADTSRPLLSTVKVGDMVLLP